MTLPREIHEVLQHDGAVAIVTSGAGGPHLVGTWQSYLEVAGNDGDTLIIPAGGYRQTQRNVDAGSRVDLLIGHEQNPPGGPHSGTGYRLEGRGWFESAGPLFDRTRARFPWARAAFLVRVEKWEKLV